MNFPINTSTSCKYKWAWSTIFLSVGDTASCHRVKPIRLNLNNFKDFHNQPKKIQDRENMLQGIRPTGGCEYCFKIEDAGGKSDRQHINESIDNITPHELLTNSNLTTITPTILEIYFSNLCNMSCLYCGPYFSSVWENEYKKYGNIFNSENDERRHWSPNKNYQEMLNLFWEWMQENGKHLRKFHILGGEPFFQPEFNDCLDYFENFPNPDCDFVIITNLMVNDIKFDYYINRLKKLVSKRKIKSLQVTASLDCWGPQIEYIRYGLNLKQWEKNFSKLVEMKWINLQVNHAVSCLSIKYMEELILKINDWNKKRLVYTSFMTIVDPTYMRPDIFGGEFFSQDLEKIIKILPDNNLLESSTKDYFLGIKKQIENNTTNINEIKKLKHFLEIIDKRRNLNYIETFPWLAKFFKDKNIGPLA
ncbi:MAG: hypothetical protein RLZZ44_855 [Bacteroidota bacterium]